MKAKIAVLPGDGIGPEIMEQGVAVMQAICKKFGHEFSYKYVPSFSLIWIIKWYEYIFYSGDIAFAGETWPQAETIIRTFWRNAKGRDLQYPFHDDNFINYYDDTKGLNTGFSKELRNKNNGSNFHGILSFLYINALKSIISAAKFIYSHLDEFQKSIKQHNTIDFVEKISWCEMLLNGADSWGQYSWGGCSLIYNGDIAERLCSPSEFKKCREGERRPNAREEWLDTQARALYQACNRIKRIVANYN